MGANRQVTGSQYCLEAGGATILIDCGMFQEREYKARNWEPSPVPPEKIDAVLLTHTHVDHCGLVPKLVKEGYRGPIFATGATADLAEIVLRDSAKIQSEDAAYKKKRHHKEGREGKFPTKPLYTIDDVDRALSLFEGVSYEQPVDVKGQVTATFHDAGHILGSSIVELKVGDGSRRRLLFSGDLGQCGKPLIRDPSCFADADYVVLESTYGGRDHQDQGDVEEQLAAVINRAVGGGGNVVIPIFAIERAQELTFHISRLVRDGRIGDLPVFLDSPMAVDVTEVFQRHRECFDVETWQLITSGEPPLRFPGLRMVRTVEQSRQINELEEPAIIMATSGMCTAGRIKFHLRRNISRPESTLLFVGYQGRGTLGRQILDGKPIVRIHGRQWKVQARVEQIDGFSGHADRAGLLRWLGYFQKPPRHLFLTHGEHDEALSLAEHVRKEMGWEVSVPQYQDAVQLR